MLDVVHFNKKLYRYRMEDEDTVLLYQLRTGNMYFLTGNARELILRFTEEEQITVDSTEKIVQFLKLIKALV